MIVVTLMGGFANQLFQYATARAYSLRNNCELYLDLSYLDRDPSGAYTKRSFELDQIKYRAKLADETILGLFRKSGFISRCFNRLGWTHYRTLNERSGRFHEELLHSNNNLLLNGYWQNERYFEQYREALMQDIVPDFSFTDEADTLLKKMRDSVSVSVHVRRGDYVSLPSANQFHGVLDSDYYKKAAEFVLSTYKNAEFFVFSDDLDWCRANLVLPGETTFADSYPKHSSQDLFLMSNCKHHIIANSSYSWWAAWLDPGPHKLVIAPEKWFRDSSGHAGGIIPESWKKIGGK